MSRHSGSASSAPARAWFSVAVSADAAGGRAGLADLVGSCCVSYGKLLIQRTILPQTEMRYHTNREDFIKTAKNRSLAVLAPGQNSKNPHSLYPGTNS